MNKIEAFEKPVEKPMMIEGKLLNIDNSIILEETRQEVSTAKHPNQKNTKSIAVLKLRKTDNGTFFIETYMQKLDLSISDRNVIIDINIVKAYVYSAFDIEVFEKHFGKIEEH